MRSLTLGDCTMTCRYTEDVYHVQEGPDEQCFAVLFANVGNGLAEPSKGFVVMFGGSGHIRGVPRLVGVSQIQSGQAEDGMCDEGMFKANLRKHALPHVSGAGLSTDADAGTQRPAMEKCQIAHKKTGC